MSISDDPLLFASQLESTSKYSSSALIFDDKSGLDGAPLIRETKWRALY